MDPISMSVIITYVSLKFIDQFISEEGYSRLRKILFPKKKYQKRLIGIINDVIHEYESNYSYDTSDEYFPFYHSQIFFEQLNGYVLFRKSSIDHELIIEKLGENQNILIPSRDELIEFFNIFVAKIKEDQLLEKLFIEENYKSKIFNIYEDLVKLETKIDHIIRDIKDINFETIFYPRESWFFNQCNASILDLGKRYTPTLNFKLEISEIFESLGRTNDFNICTTKHFNDFLIKGKKLKQLIHEPEEHCSILEAKLYDFFLLVTKTDYTGNDNIPIENFDTLLNQIEKTVQDLFEYYSTKEKETRRDNKGHNNSDNNSYIQMTIREFENELYKLKDIINGLTFQLANNPFLLLTGEAGIGKSHLLGDVISKRIKEDQKSIFLLGQHFVTEEDPWTQIFKKLQINTTFEVFLRKINKKAEQSGKRIIIVIDAINEGKGNYFWNDNLISFVNEVRKCKWLGLILSIRSSYKKLIVPDEEIESLDIIEFCHYGFRNIEYEASKLFFENYKIELPSVPLLHPEFQNPLFLKLFCEGISKAGLTRIPDGLQGITSIIDFFITNVNIVLSKPKHIGYSSSINLVQKSINALVEIKIARQLRYVPYELAYKIVDESISDFIIKRGFIDDLIAEGVLSKNLFWKKNHDYEEGVYLAYERFEDHLTAQYLLEQYPELKTEFENNGKLHNYVINENAIYRNRGLIDAFSIQIPEIHNCEFFSFIPDLKDISPVVESFVESLLWRKIDTINEESKQYVNECVFSSKGTHDLFWETIIAITGIPKHLFNAYLLNDYLKKFSIADRDATWTQFLKYKYNDDSSIKRLIDWAWNDVDKSHISDESILLSSIALSWFHTSTNRQLRDCSTKALICLLQSRMHVLLQLLKTFENVNDPYVYERIFAVAYGCAIRTNNNEILAKLCNYIYQTIFKDKEEVYPHVLLRDYAKGVIEYAYSQGIDFSFSIDEVRPPYRSSFPNKIITNNEIDKKYKFEYSDRDFKKYYWSQNSILSSMTTEYGRGICGYGDFGRYTFDSAFSSWDVNTDNLSNLAIEWIFEKYGYDVDKHGEYDRNTNSSGRRGGTIERIGKKYQWIALYEMLARVSDNFPKYANWNYKKEEKEPYQGPWNPYVRDIDPTMLISKTGRSIDNQSQENWWMSNSLFDWSCSNENWVNNTNDLPNFGGIIQKKDDKGDEWLVLEAYPSWSEPTEVGDEKWDKEHKEFWCHLRSYLVKADEFEPLKSWADQQNSIGRLLPESSDRYEMFSREYYWSIAQDYFMNDYYGNPEWTEVYDMDSEDIIAEVNVTAQSFLWEEEYDKSKDDTISFLKPSTVLFRGMGISYGQREGVLVDNMNVIQCFAPNVYNNTDSFLLIRKSSLIQFLDENKLKIMWTVLGEKQIIGGRTTDRKYLGRIEVNGFYYNENNILTGKYNTKRT